MTDDHDQRDEFATDDAEFGQALAIIMQDLSTPLAPQVVEAAAKALSRLAVSSGDRLKLSCFLARFDDYLQAGRAAPLPIQQAIRQAFMRFRSGTSMDDAFGLKADRRGRKPSWGVREWARTNANLVAFWVSKGSTLEVAVERVAEFREQSEGQIKRDYLRYRRRIKSE
ncbi:hypothetical protein [Thauera mechernichensis]